MWGGVAFAQPSRRDWASSDVCCLLTEAPAGSGSALASGKLGASSSPHFLPDENSVPDFLAVSLSGTAQTSPSGGSHRGCTSQVGLLENTTPVAARSEAQEGVL